MDFITKKRLVFSFYLDKGSFEHPINHLHFKLLKRYINDFQEVVFCIITELSMDDDLVKRLKKEIINMYSGNIIFKIYPNTEYRETYVFKNEIVDKMKYLDGYTLFAHNKGISNIEYMHMDVVTHWVTGLYYFNFVEDVKDVFQYFNVYFYGAFKDYLVEDYSYAQRPIHNWYYSGTFFWGNYQLINEQIKAQNIEMPTMHTRWYDENFPGNIVDESFARTYQQRYVISGPLQDDNFFDWVKLCYPDETYDNFMKYCDDVEREEWIPTVL